MKCQNCNNDILNNEKFCSKCGTAVNQNINENNQGIDIQNNSNNNINASQTTNNNTLGNNNSNMNNTPNNNINNNTNNFSSSSNSNISPNNNNNSNLKVIIIVIVIVVIVIIGLVWNFLNVFLKNASDFQTDYNDNSSITKGLDKTNPSKLEKNISIKYVTTQNNKVVVFVTNSNKKNIKAEIETVYYDANNNPIDSENNYVTLPANQEQAYRLLNVPKTGVAKYDFKVKISEYESSAFYEELVDKLTIKENDTAEKLIVQATNNHTSKIDSISLTILFYQNGKIVDCLEDSKSSTNSNETVTFTIRHPYDSSFKDVPYDSYKIFTTAYNY